MNSRSRQLRGTSFAGRFPRFLSPTHRQAPEPRLKKSVAVFTTALLAAGLLSVPSLASATVQSNPAAVSLGAAASYSVLGATGVGNSGATTLSGNLGLSQSGLIAGFGPGIVNGTTNDKNAAATRAETDRLAAYNNADGRTADTDFAGDNNGRTYTPGVYHSVGAFALTGTMVLDGQNNPNAVFIFNIDAALNAAASSRVRLINGAQPGNVFWRVLGAAGTGADAEFSGTIIATGAITLGAASRLNGRALSAGMVTLSNNAIITAEPTSVPDAPTSVNATAANATASVSWTAPRKDGGAAITGYTVTSSPDGVIANTAGATAVTVSGLTNGTAYTFSVVATNATGDSVSSSASAPVTPVAPTVPGAPTAVTASTGNTEAIISWTAPILDGHSAITGYTVTSSPGGLTVTTSGATTATVVALTNGTAYTFTVVATNAIGDSVSSDASTAATPSTKPGAPTVGTATAGNGDASVSWAAPASDGGSAITGFTVVSFPGGHSVTTADGTATTATVSGLINGTDYTFSVVATNAAGNSASSEPSGEVTPMAPTVAAAPEMVTVSGGDTEATVAWTAPSSNGDSAITGYTVTSSPGGHSATTTDASDTSVIVSGLTNGAAYTFTVVATNAIGNSRDSAESETVTPSAPRTSTSRPGSMTPPATVTTPITPSVVTPPATAPATPPATENTVAQSTTSTDVTSSATVAQASASRGATLPTLPYNDDRPKATLPTLPFQDSSSSGAAPTNPMQAFSMKPSASLSGLVLPVAVGVLLLLLVAVGLLLLVTARRRRDMSDAK